MMCKHYSYVWLFFGLYIVYFSFLMFLFVCYHVGLYLMNKVSYINTENIYCMLNNQPRVFCFLLMALFIALRSPTVPQVLISRCCRMTRRLGLLVRLYNSCFWDLIQNIFKISSWNPGCLLFYQQISETINITELHRTNMNWICE